MKLKLDYAGQLGIAAGASAEEVDVSPGSTIAEIIVAAAGRHGSGFAELVQNRAGEIERTLLVAIDGEQVTDLGRQVGDSARELMILPPIAGG
jgi:molybdopterin converting factor small subunit